VTQFRAVTDARIIVQPNAGRPELVGTEVVYKQTPKLMAASVEDLIAAGANIIGGCCGTTPEHIRLFAEKLKTFK
jgi:5-methyltetrahydrofolate--homocysteine methyltransferase